MTLYALTIHTCNRSAAPANVTDGFQAVTSSDTATFANDGNTRLLADAAAGSNLTIVTPATIDGMAVAELVLVIPTSSKVMAAGPFPVSVYGETVTVTVDATTSVFVMSG